MGIIEKIEDRIKPNSDDKCLIMLLSEATENNITDVNAIDIIQSLELHPLIHFELDTYQTYNLYKFWSRIAEDGQCLIIVSLVEQMKPLVRMALAFQLKPGPKAMLQIGDWQNYETKYMTWPVVHWQNDEVF